MVKNLPSDARDMGLIPGLGRSLEKEMATHSSILAWRIQGQRSLAGYSPWGRKESDRTELTGTITYGKLQHVETEATLSKYIPTL